MPQIGPFRRTCRQFVDGTYSNGQYISHPKFALDPEHYVRAFTLIQKDLFELFDYIEPSDTNLSCYSYRIHELHMRTCIEIEANFKAILRENGYSRSGDWNMKDYKKLEATHLLSAYEVKFPVWHGAASSRTPFAPWATGGGLDWYQAYNDAKHDRHDKFSRASFGNLLEAICGLVVILSAQFHTEDFSKSGGAIVWGGPPAGYNNAIGDYFLVKFPTTWPTADRYDFDWQSLSQNADPFQTLAL
jgi:hypothetical protein